MSVSKTIAFGTIVAWASRVTTILLGMYLLPVLFKNLQEEELGLWLLIGQTASIFAVLDLGLNFTLTRRIAFAHGKSLEEKNAESARNEIANLLETFKYVFFALAITVALLSISIGTLYLSKLGLSPESFFTASMGWAILCLTNSATILAWRWSCVLQGTGYVGWESIVSSAISVAIILAQLLSVWLGGGLVALAAVSGVGALLQRKTLLYVASRKRPDVFKIRGKFDKALVKSMLVPALKAWVTGLGWAVAIHTDQFFVVYSMGAASFPAYRAAYLVLFNIALISITVASTSSAFVSHAWQAGRMSEVRQLLLRNARVALFTMACGGGMVIGLGGQLFDVWLGNDHFIGYGVLSVFFVMLVLEVQANAVSTSARATEDEAYAYTSICAAVIKICLAIALVRSFGLTGIAIATMVALALTNHWYMVYRGLLRCGVSVRHYSLQVLIPAGCLFIWVLGVTSIVKSSLSESGPVYSVLIACTCAGLTWAFSVWTLILSSNERQGVLAIVMLSRLKLNEK